MGHEATDAEVQEVYDKFWKHIVEPDGDLDIEQVKKELFDYRHILDEVPKVYMAITSNRFSKPLTAADVIIDAAETHYKWLYSEDEPDEGAEPVLFTGIALQDAKPILELVGVCLARPGYSVELVLKAIKATPYLQDLIRIVELAEVAGDTDIVCPFCAVVGDRDHLQSCLVKKARKVLSQVKSAMEIEPECPHSNVVSARNEVIASGLVCKDCGALLPER